MLISISIILIILLAVEVFFSSNYWKLTELAGFPESKFNGEGVLVALLDTGVNLDHVALKGTPCEPSAIRYGRNFVGGEAGNLKDESSICHGTAVAGVVAGTHRLYPDKQVKSRYTGFGDEKLPLGVAPKASLVICKIADEGPNLDAVIKALRWIHAHNTVVMRLDGYKHIEATHVSECGMCQKTEDCNRRKLKIGIINMAFRLFVDDSELKQWITDLNKQHVLCVAGADNNGYNQDPGYPALYDNVLTVGTVNSSGNTSGFSTRHPRVDVHALGEDVLVATSSPSVSDGTFERQSRSAFASSAVAGLLAILIQCAREQGGEELAQQITTLDTLKKLMKKHLLYEIPEPSNYTAYLLRPQYIKEFFQNNIGNLSQVIKESDAISLPQSRSPGKVV